ncbi:hypothetical protein VC83_05151 [Pseudogymnoascus destructans]|uniref:Uncharacterized protein n=2 Tax=Pseudogymnoascus destructans TaxID=655981 RepID=L8FQ11_PSED2|nr:uncharacterized protein VC83_05151 [Pseudogymnoascus destructans]ELR03055.1 hypothetical protein GMDG_05902 [Pseudogymnoascus destructans 20631-21]OAF58556.2 hypothetical protein VC83_05151 [Pseudogymnoascus destructans]
MRYQNWDVLLFSDKSKVPIQEFKTTCHVIQDSGKADDGIASLLVDVTFPPQRGDMANRLNAEYLPTQGTLPLLPTVTSFLPALGQGQNFRLSIHSWEAPEPSRFALNFTKEPGLIMFEARVFIDGRLAGYRYLGRDGPWPTIIETGINVNKNGDLEPLRFPEFHQELLSQNYWNAGDDLGRIKIIIAEGLHRESPAMSFDRIKNIVAFSFQHAPLEVLESSSIAWPNAEMWRHISFVAGMLPGGNVPRKSSEGAVEAHSHSPRRRSISLARPQRPPPAMGMMLPPGLPVFPRPANFDPFTERRATQWRQPSSADVSMPDYSSSVSLASHSRQFTDPISSNKPEPQRFQSLESIGAFEGLCEALKPSNVTKKSVLGDSDDVRTSQNKASKVPDDHRSIRTIAGQTTPATVPESGISGSVKSRKENAQDSPLPRETLSEGNNFTFGASQPSSAISAAEHKRQRVVTPASVKAIDQEDEPKNSIMRKISQGSAGRRALGELPNVL